VAVGTRDELAREARESHENVTRANTALNALARKPRADSRRDREGTVGRHQVGGRRFTVTKYLPRSEAYGKDNDGLTATLRKAESGQAQSLRSIPSSVPYGSQVWVEGLGWFDAQDCGRRDQGLPPRRADQATMEDAMAFGKQDRFVIVVPPTV
jgi:3D (Asp-Asp-Asp) domain-containing protein